MNAKFFLKLFLAILLIAAALRFTKLGQIPVALYWDEVAILVDAKSLAATGRDMHGQPWHQLIFPSYGDYKLPVYIWLSALAVKIFGASDWSVRVVSAGAGIGTVVVVGLIAKLLFKNSATTSSALLQLSVMTVVAFAPWSIIFSRTGFEGHLAQFLVATSIWLLLLAQQHLSSALQNRQAGLSFVALLVASVLLGVAATYTYFSVRFVWPVVSSGFWLLYWSKYRKINHRPQWWLGQLLATILVPLFIFWGLLTPMTHSSFYEVSNQFRLSTNSIFNSFDYALASNQLREQAGNTWLDRIVFHRHLLLLKELALNYADHLNLNYLFVSGDANLRHGTTQHGLFLAASLPIFLYGLIKLWLNHKRVWLTLVVWWLAALLPAAVPETTPHALRSLNALVPVAIIIGFGLSELIVLCQRKHHRWPVALVAILLSANALNFIHFANHYFKHYPQQSASFWQAGYRELAEEIAEQRTKVSQIWVDQGDGRFYLWLLAYDHNLTSQEIQTLPKTDFQLTKIHNIEFTGPNWDKLEDQQTPFLIAGEVAAVEEKLLANSLKPAWIKNIKDPTGGNRFVVAFFGQ